MKNIDIFIGSSIDEFKTERQELINFIYDLRDILSDNGYVFRLMPKICENEDNAMSLTRKQDDYNLLIKNSRMCLFLFGKKVGNYSLEELNCAFSTFSDRGDGSPVINIFFRNAKDGNPVDPSVEKLEAELVGKQKEFFRFSNLETVKYRILQNLTEFHEFEGLSSRFEMKDGFLCLWNHRIVDMGKTEGVDIGRNRN